MQQIITKINREKGYTYRVDKQGNVIKSSYNILKDPFTLVMLTILILGALYYIQLKDMKTTEANFEESCLTYVDLRNQWMQDHPGQIPTLEEVFSQEVDDYSYNG
jgi:hypothetical protein